ncbi:MAG: hypothetical protein AAB863_01355, partial [Patescibacteria group bacterium]
MKRSQAVKKSSTFLRGIRSSRNGLNNANASSKQAAGYYGKVRDKKAKVLNAKVGVEKRETKLNSKAVLVKRYFTRP